MRRNLGLRLLMIFLSSLLFISLISYIIFIEQSKDPQPVSSYTNGLAQKPLLGWSSWSAIRFTPTQWKIQAQAQAMTKTLKLYGYTYINLDDYWYLNPATTVDSFGRWVADPKTFPDGIGSLSAYVHNLGLKFGIYLNPGIPIAAVQQNTSIEGTQYHARDIAVTTRYETSYSFDKQEQYVIDYNKPGAQEYINSWAHLLAQWNIDFLKLDGLQPPHASQVQALTTIHAWSVALKQSGRPIYFDLSGTFQPEEASSLRANANGWRIDRDVECYGSCTGWVSWQYILLRFKDAPLWARWAGPGGWSNLDSLDVGNGVLDGLTDDERQSYMSLWVISAAPLSIGDDLTTLDDYGIQLLTNDEVITIDQLGVAGTAISTTTQQQVWRTKEADGSYVVALFNLGDSTAPVGTKWSALGINCPASVRDLWSHTDIGIYSDGFSALLNSHASRLLKLTPTCI